MLDRYWYGATARISPEAPVPVVHVGRTEERPGGAGNVATNLSALQAGCTLLGLRGDDEAGRTLQLQLETRDIEAHLIATRSHPTITKLRVISRNQQLIRLDFEQGLDGHDDGRLREALEPALEGAGVLILSDYGKGTLGDVAELIELGRMRNLPVLVDPKGRDFSRYRGATLLTPNMGEFEAVMGPCADESELADKAARLIEQLELDALLVTRSEHGMSLFRRRQPVLHLPARAREVFDVTGAGDTVIAVLGAALGAGAPLEEAAALANLAAGLVVGKLGAASVSPAELRLAASTEHGQGRVVEEDALMDAVANAREKGERVVMTNGCFDLLHAGHVAYLRQARELGDRLVVAVNDDASVTRLKGADRPLNPLEDRMAVLAGLECVDWVVSFAEDTPERLICRVLPDVLVKGGDYRPDQIAGAGCVTDNGGEVKVLDYIEGRSTTGMIHKLRGS